MCVLLAIQFNAAPDAFINRTAGLGETQQITAGGGKIRPPGTFSFVSGVIFYAAISTSYLLYAALSRGLYRNWLLFSAGFALVVTIGVSGSRSTLLAVVVVISSLGAIILIRPRAINQFGRNLLIVVVVLVIVTRLPVFKEGVQILSDRFTDTAEAEETTIASGLLARTFSGFTEGISAHEPGTDWRLRPGHRHEWRREVFDRPLRLPLTEGEWGRVILESGPILGLAFLLWRTWLTIKLGFFSFKQLTMGNILPIMLYAAGFMSLLSGQFGQPTNLGFAVFVCGLCLAAGNTTTAPRDAELSTPAPALPRPMARRSRYAERLHHSSATPRNSDDSFDR